MVKNADFIENAEDKVSIHPDIHIKVSGFGLSELFDLEPKHRQKPYSSDSLVLNWETVDQHPFGCSKFHMNTPYRAPKIWNGLPYDARKSDTWEMGIVLFKMATGTYPYHFENGHEPMGDSGTGSVFPSFYAVTVSLVLYDCE